MLDVESSPMFTHGTSRVDPSKDQLDPVLMLLESALTSLKPLLHDGKLTTKVSNALGDIPTRSDGWIVTDENGDPRKFPEVLFPAEWNRLRASSHLNAKTILRYSSLSPSPALAAPIYKYLLKDQSLTPKLFVDAYSVWMRAQIEGCISLTEHVLQDWEEIPNERKPFVLHGCFAGIFGISKALHNLCEISPGNEELDKLRERSAYLLELYRYQDDILTVGVESVVREASDKTSAIAELGTPRIFQDALYNLSTAPLSKLKARYPVEDGLVPELISGKYLRALRYLSTRISGENPPVVIVLVDTDQALKYTASVFEAASIGAFKRHNLPPDYSVLTVNGSATKKRRDAAISSVLHGERAILVTTELKGAPEFIPDQRVLVLSLAQHKTPLSEYPFIKELKQKGAKVHCQTLITKGSSDWYRRIRARLLRRGPADPEVANLADNEGIPLPSPNLPSEMVAFLEKLSKTLIAYDRRVEKFGSISQTEMNNFKRSCKKIVEDLSQTVNSPRRAYLLRNSVEKIFAGFLTSTHSRLQSDLDFGNDFAQSFMHRVNCLMAFADTKAGYSPPVAVAALSSLRGFLKSLTEDVDNYAEDISPLHIALPDLRVREALASRITSRLPILESEIESKDSNNSYRRYLDLLSKDLQRYALEL